MKFICETFLWMIVIFRDESNEPIFIIIGYSGATVTASNHYPYRTVKGLISYNNCYNTIVVEVVS